MKVYVIDDEPKIRRGLMHFIAHEKPDWPQPKSAATAEEALQDPCFWETELMFLDIQLPAMSGLELLSLIRDKGSQMQVVIISGYAEFSFAQQALRLQVYEYLLKPIDIQKVSLILNNVQTEALQKQKDLRAKETVRQNLHKIREKYFASVLFGTESAEPEQCAKHLRELEMRDSPFLMIQYTYRSNEPLKSENIKEAQRMISDKLQTYMPLTKDRFMIYLKSGIVAILLAADDRLDGILETLQTEGDTEAYQTGFSFVHQSLSELLLAYSEACGERPSEEVVQNLPHEDQTLYVEQLIRRQGEFHPYVQKIMHFVADNYSTSLNLSVVAAQIHLHTSYLSELFKKETGTNLCNYINDYRLLIAKYELKGGNAKIAEIAEKVGFNDYHYFSQVFSKRVGVPPRKYRMNNLTK
ncbi:MAG: response regulator [Oscillospiraceae bacterium]|nr:response regulator [Oscillospiraceae bacterium]